MNIVSKTPVDVNLAHRGPTHSGRINHRPLVTEPARDFPPDSVYWMRFANAATDSLAEHMTPEQFDAWVEALDDNATWWEIYNAAEAALATAATYATTPEALFRAEVEVAQADYAAQLAEQQDLRHGG